MDTVNLSSLLLSEEDRIRTELQADSAIDQNRKQSVERLNNVMDGILLRYNAANADDRNRQALADCQAAAVRDPSSFRCRDLPSACGDLCACLCACDPGVL